MSKTFSCRPWRPELLPLPLPILLPLLPASIAADQMKKICREWLGTVKTHVHSCKGNQVRTWKPTSVSCLHTYASMCRAGERVSTRTASRGGGLGVGQYLVAVSKREGRSRQANLPASSLSLIIFAVAACEPSAHVGSVRVKPSECLGHAWRPGQSSRASDIIARQCADHCRRRLRNSEWCVMDCGFTN